MNKEKDDREDEHQQLVDNSQSNGSTNVQNSNTIIYGDSPLNMRCPFCLQHIRSELILKPQFISVALGISIFAIVPNFYMLFLVIALMHLTSARKHRCPLCERQLGSDGKFLLYFTDELYSFSIFSAGFLFTKKMLITAILLIFAFTLLSIRATYINYDRMDPTTWAQYLTECGSGDANACLNKYKGKMFMNWQGHVLRMTDNRQMHNKWYLHALSLYMKMQPQIKQGLPDVLLTLNSEALYYNEEVLKTLKHGDHIKFNCTLHEKERGSLKDVMHFHIQTIQIIGHDQNYAMFTTQIEEEWIQVNLQNKQTKLRSQESNEAAG